MNATLPKNAQSRVMLVLFANEFMDADWIQNQFLIGGFDVGKAILVARSSDGLIFAQDVEDLHGH